MSSLKRWNGEEWEPLGGGSSKPILTFIPPFIISAWTSNTHSSDTEGAFPYRASITCSGVTSDMFAEVVLGTDDAMSGSYAPICETGNGVVYIWGNDNTLSPSIQSILVHKGA